MLQCYWRQLHFVGLVLYQDPPLKTEDVDYTRPPSGFITYCSSINLLWLVYLVLHTALCGLAVLEESDKSCVVRVICSHHPTSCVMV